MKPPGATRLTVVPITIPTANIYIDRWHRHHAPLVTVHGGTTRLNKGFAWFALAVVTEGEIVGVAVIGRPTNRNSDDGQTMEVLRLASNGWPNACSALLGACARTAKEMGAATILTYTLTTEPGTSLRAAGWSEDGDGIQSCWTKGKGKARRGGSGNTIQRAHFDVPKKRWVKEIRERIEVNIEREESDAAQEVLFAE